MRFNGKTLTVFGELGDTGAYEAGRKAEYDKFWDFVQENGNRTNYEAAFQGVDGNYHIWHNDMFFPKYDIRPIGNAQRMFYSWSKKYQTGLDLAQRLEDCGVVFDTSKATSLYYAFIYAFFSRLPVIDLTGITETDGARAMFAYGGETFKTLDKLVVNENTTCLYAFQDCSGLENITIDGTIGQDGYDFHWSTKLTHASLMSIINALKNFTDGTTRTVTLGATNIAKLTDAEKAIATQKGWTLA